jgi:hypothetical protein
LTRCSTEFYAPGGDIQRRHIQTKKRRLSAGVFCFEADLKTSFRGDAKYRITMRNCASENLEVPGSMLRIAPE